VKNLFVSTTKTYSKLVHIYSIVESAKMQQTRESEVSGVAEESDEMSGPMLVNVLESHGISAADIKKLKEAGYNTVESVVYAPKKNLLVTFNSFFNYVIFVVITNVAIINVVKINVVRII